MCVCLTSKFFYPLILLLKTGPQNSTVFHVDKLTCDAGWWVSKTHLLFQSLQSLPNLRHIWSRKACVRFFLVSVALIGGLFSPKYLKESLGLLAVFQIYSSSPPSLSPLPLEFFYTWDFPCYAGDWFSCCLAASPLPHVSFGYRILYASCRNQLDRLFKLSLYMLQPGK